MWACGMLNGSESGIRLETTPTHLRGDRDERDSHMSSESRQNGAKGGAVVIEAMGLPASGKTTACDDAIARLRESGECVLGTSDLVGCYGSLARNTRINRILGLLAACVLRPVIPLRALRFFATIRRPRRGNLKHLVRFLYEYDVLMQARRHQTNVPILLDQGLLQGLAAMLVGASSYREDQLCTLIRTIRRKLNISVVCFQSDPADAYGRMWARGTNKTVFERYPGEHTFDQFVEFSQHIAQVHSILESQGGTALAFDSSQQEHLDGGALSAWLASGRIPSASRTGGRAVNECPEGG